ncbi:nuclear receptor 2C2-associated protein isoform X2 [Pithys albifrons albifrons]|uniref:nuclear receptor 2C2-associated protein isoform X2 n=1 Tax=Pithys albifrons albifrons TaxID=3385563 RepID=UPI003A5CFB27
MIQGVSNPAQVSPVLLWVSPVLLRAPQYCLRVPTVPRGSPVRSRGSPILPSYPKYHPGVSKPAQAAMPLEPLVCADTTTRVSSVLNRDGKQFGKKHMFDMSEETCWNSDQGTYQWVTLDFPRPVKVSQLHIQFQGGFSSRLCTLEGRILGQPLEAPQHLNLHSPNPQAAEQVKNW